jgi:hypothetical protein
MSIQVNCRTFGCNHPRRDHDVDADSHGSDCSQCGCIRYM